MPYRITYTRMQGDTPTGSVVIEVPDEYPFDETWGVQVPDPFEPEEIMPLFGEPLLEAAANCEFGLKIVGFGPGAFENLVGSEQEASVNPAGMSPS